VGGKVAGPRGRGRAERQRQGREAEAGPEAGPTVFCKPHLQLLHPAGGLAELGGGVPVRVGHIANPLQGRGVPAASRH
jgi:hypothetical protein